MRFICALFFCLRGTMRGRILFIFLLASAACNLMAAAPLRISEFSAGGRQGLSDEDGESPDWIELENTSAEPVNLAGWNLSDNSRSKKAWQFPSTNVAPGQFLILFASSKDRRIPGRFLHTNFKLNADRGALLLTSPTGDASIIESYPPQIAGISFGITGSEVTAHYAYLHVSTPGRSNSPAVSVGPYIYSVERSPLQPAGPQDSLLVRAKVSSTLSPLAKLTLRYRIMFGREKDLLMYDDGKNGDVVATDGIHTASIPAGVAKPGEMIRYCVAAEDSLGRTSRWPLFSNRAGYSAYEGTVISDLSIESRLPVYHLFFPPNSPALEASTEAVLFHLGELYDRVLISPHGQISATFPKPSFNLDFPHDHRFRYRANEARVSDIKMLANFGDKSKIRNALAYEMIEAAGSIGHFAFPIRLQRNGKFFCLAEVVEDGDDRWLTRAGLDPQGALYKMYGNLNAVGQAEKKTRRTEGTRDLVMLASALAEYRPLPERVAYALDNINIPQCISYLVAMSLISSGDHGHKNYYLYRDTRGTGEWALLPWDVDLSFGRNWTKTYFDDRIYFDNPLSLYRAGRKDQGRNPFYNLFFEHPPFREMYLRRLRTVIDELLQPSGSSTSSKIETRIRELMDLIDPPKAAKSDADLDSEQWPAWRTPRSARAEAQRIIDDYISPRRTFLLHRATLRGDPVPQAQPADVVLKFAEIRNGQSPGDQFICITNQNEFAVDITHWKISGAGVEFQFRPGTVVPSNGSLYVLADTRAFRAQRRSENGTAHQLTQGNWTGSLQSGGTLHLTDSKGRVVSAQAPGPK